MFFDIYNLGIKSVPVNVLNPIKKTPFENNKILSQEEIKRIVAIARFILLDVFIRLAVVGFYLKINVHLYFLVDQMQQLQEICLQRLVL